MKKQICKTLALLLCVMMLSAVLPASVISVSAAGDIYANELIKYSFNPQCTGRYFTPIKKGKYPTFVMICGQGGDGMLRSNLRYFINEWVKAGYFPPMNVVIPAVEDFDGQNGRYLEDFMLYMKRDNMFGTLLENIESGALSPQIDTNADVLVAGFSMGGMCALACGAEYNTRIKKLGALSPSAKFYIYEGAPDAYYPYKKDICYSHDPDGFLLMAAGLGEQSGSDEFTKWMEGFEYAIKSGGNYKSGFMTRYDGPAAWGGHAWPLEKKEIFMYLYRVFYGTMPSESLVESVCDSSPAPVTPADREKDTAHPAQEAAIEPYRGNKLINLDMSTFEKNTTTNPAAAASIGNVSNSGTLASSTKVKMSSKSGTSFGLDLNKKTFTNALGSETSYLERTVNGNTSADNKYTVIEEPALETGDNTISFWSKYTPVNREGAEYSLFDYSTKYSGESAPTHLFTFDQAVSSDNKFILTGRYGKTGRWDDTQYGDITDEAAGKWAQYTITNPAYSSNGKKTIKVYLNGKYLYSKIVSKPEGNAQTAMLAFGGENTQGENLFWPENYTLGNVTVYDGVLSADEIYSEYALNKDYYVENNSGLPNITGYTLSDSTVYYDGENHMINVSAASGATQGVSIAYTCGGSAFTGATEVGIYPVTATVSKEGYNDLILNAKLAVKEKYTPPVYNNGDVLIDLDMSSYVKDTETDPNSVTTSIGAVTNNGTLAASTVVKMSSKSAKYNGIDLTKEKFANGEGGETSFLHRTLSSTAVKTANEYNMIEEKALETGANTITFWANYVPEGNSGYYSLFDYNATYDGETQARHLLSLGQEPTTSGYLKLTDGQDSANVDITSEAAEKWAYYTITNPAYENGKKTMNVYVNGILKYSKTVTKPEGDIVSAKLSFGGELSPVNNLYWPSDFSLGDVRVMGGVMSKGEILASYEDGKAKYEAQEEPFDFDVSFDKENNAFTVSTESIFEGVNNISLIVLNGEGDVVYMDAKNAYKENDVSFAVKACDIFEAGEYTFILASDGDTAGSGTKICSVNDEFGIYGEIAPGSSVSAEYTLAEGEAEPTVIIAVYKGGSVAHVSVSKTAEEGKVTASIGFAADEDVTGYTAKAFVWKDLQNINPLKRARVLK